MIEMAVKSTVDRIATDYVRERHLPAILPAPWGDTARIVARLERGLTAASNGLARGHWAASANRTLAIRGALQAERATLAKELGA
jgi:hypothetical protein